MNRSSDRDAPPLFVPSPFAAVAGALCPEVLPTLRGDAAGDAPADGFIDRDLDDPFPATLGKLREYGLRLAGRPWCLRRAAEPPVRMGPGAGGGSAAIEFDARPPVIGAATLLAAATLAEYFEAHARRCHGLGAAGCAGRVARWLRDWLDGRRTITAFTRSQAYQQLEDKRDIRNGEALNAPLSLLCDHGFLKMVASETGGPGPGPRTYAVKPALGALGVPSPRTTRGTSGTVSRPGRGTVMRKPAPAAARPPDSPYLTAAEVAAYRRRKKTLLNHKAAGTLRAVPGTRPPLFRVEDLDAWVAGPRR